ncbi:hypothetical protein D9M68_771610 [compost metagenome]
MANWRWSICRRTSRPSRLARWTPRHNARSVSPGVRRWRNGRGARWVPPSRPAATRWAARGWRRTSREARIILMPTRAAASVSSTTPRLRPGCCRPSTRDATGPPARCAWRSSTLMCTRATAPPASLRATTRFSRSRCTVPATSRSARSRATSTWNCPTAAATPNTWKRWSAHWKSWSSASIPVW